MLMPSIFGENLFDEFFGDWDREMRRMDRKLYGRNAAREMKSAGSTVSLSFNNIPTRLIASPTVGASVFTDRKSVV